jgi:cysteine desulfurase family protein (TIGR01976 family)
MDIGECDTFLLQEDGDHPSARPESRAQSYQELILANFPIQKVREQFPALDSPAAFFDNPAGTQVPRPVIDAISDALIQAASNLGTHFANAKRANDIYGQAHDAMAELLGGSSGREIVIGQSTTMLTFQMSRSLGRRWNPGDELIVTLMDHEANISPWVRLAEERGLVIRWLPFNRETWRVEPEDLKRALNDKTRLLALNYASNLTGSINPVAELASIAKKAGALVYIDSVQFTPHGLVDVQKVGCDFLACSSYKFFGPHLGVLWGREAILGELYPYAPRCAPQTMPGRHGNGTPQTELLAGLIAAVDYLVWLGEQTGATGGRRAKLAHAYSAASAYEMPLAHELIDGLLAVPGIQIHGITDASRLRERVPTVSMTHRERSNSSLARALAEQGINTWSGNMYAVEAIRHLGLDNNEGVLRIGLAHYNTAAEVKRVITALHKVAA